MSAPLWREIPGFAGYEVSDRGQVRSSLGASSRILKPVLNTHGYPTFKLMAGDYGDRRVVTIAAHRVVLIAFVGPRPVGMVTRHLNGVRTDSRLSNLTYGTSSENQLDQVRHGTHPEARRSHCSRGHRLGDDNVYQPKARGHRACGTCRRAYMALYERSTRAEREQRKAAGLPVIDLDGYFASVEVAA